VAAAAATLPTKATRARAASPAVACLPGPPSAVVDSRRCAWPDHGRPSIHTTLGTNLSFVTDVRCLPAAGHISILDALAWFMGPTVAGQLLQHDDASDTALTYRVVTNSSALNHTTPNPGNSSLDHIILLYLHPSLLAIDPFCMSPQ
jgi:hypothetical protein